jgi:hypothetical protein
MSLVTQRPQNRARYRARARIPTLSGKDEAEWLVSNLHCGFSAIGSHNFAARL